MKLFQRFAIRKSRQAPELLRGIWSPTTKEWRDIIEHYMSLSRKSFNNKLSMFKLQLWILEDLVNNSKAIKQIKAKLKELKSDKENQKISDEDFEADNKHLNSEIFGYEHISDVLREIIDGIVWRYFDYKRGYLYLLADKQPINLIIPNEGLINSLYEFAELFLEPNNKAIFCDISNFIRIGDILNIRKDGSLELIEVKSSKHGGSRLTRQKERMKEIIDFFNIGEMIQDGEKYRIITYDSKQQYHLSALKDTILRAKNKGYDSILLGNYVILNVIDFDRLNNLDKAFEYFDSKHESIKDKWKIKNDFIFPSFYIEKMQFSRNYAPFSIFPFNAEMCTDIMIGKLMIHTEINFTEILRILEKSGWRVVDSIVNRPEEITKEDIWTVPFCIVKKGELTFPIRFPSIGRLQFELLSPKSIIEELNYFYNIGPVEEPINNIINYSYDEEIWD